MPNLVENPSKPEIAPPQPVRGRRRGPSLKFIGLLGDKGGAVVTPFVPDVANRYGLEIQLFRQPEKRRDQGVAGTVARPYESDSDAIIGAQNPRIAGGVGTDGDRGSSSD